MRIPFATRAARVLCLALLASATLVTTSCKEEEETAAGTPPKDYSAIDDAIIQKYLTDNSITTARKQTSGLYFLPVRTIPAAYQPVVGNIVHVKYTGRLMDGTVFDATSRHGDGNTPIDFPLGARKVIRGWDEGIALMRKGEKAELLIPSALAYGNSSPSPAIPPNSVLRFEVELVEVR